MKTMTDTLVVMIVHVPCDANYVQDIARQETTFTGLTLKPFISAGENLMICSTDNNETNDRVETGKPTLAGKHANRLGRAKLCRSQNR